MNRSAWILVPLLAVMLSACTAQAASRGVPAPPVRTATVTPAEPETVTPTPTPQTAEAPALTDGQRATLDVTFGVGTPIEQTYRDTYCPMDANGRKYYAHLAAIQLGYTDEMVLAYMTEWCGS